MIWPWTTFASPEDIWTGYHTQRDAILRALQNTNGKIIFLSGDVHCSMIVSLSLPNRSEPIHSVISSGFNWPFPGLLKGHFNFDTLKSDSLHQDEYRLRLISGDDIVTRNNFNVITVESPSKVNVRCYDGHNGNCHYNKFL